MKFIKVKSLQICTNGSLMLTVTSLTKPGQTLIYKKDYKSLELSQNQKSIPKFEISNNFYKTHYKI